MKKILLLLTIVMFVFTFSACNSAQQNELPEEEQTLIDNSEEMSESETIKEEEESETNPEFVDTPIRKCFRVRSIEEFKQMKEMLSCEDEDKLREYLYSIGAHSKDDLELFLELSDRFGVVNTIDGKISSISYMESEVVPTGEDYTEFSIVVKAENGDWIVYEYLLFSERTVDLTPPEGNLLDGSLTSDDNRITLIWETRGPHATYDGTYIKRRALIDGVYLRIREFTTTPDEVKVDEILNGELVTASSMME